MRQAAAIAPNVDGPSRSIMTGRDAPSTLKLLGETPARDY